MNILPIEHSFRLLLLALMLALPPAPTAQADALQSNNERLYEDAVQRFEKKQYESAIIQLRNILQADPDHLPARILLGKARLFSGNAAAAQKELEFARKLGADKSLIAIPLAQALTAQHKYQEVLDSFDPDQYPLKIAATLYTKRGIALIELNRLDLAEEAFEKSLLIQPGSAQATAGLALVYLRTGNFNKADEKLDEALKLDPENPDVWMVKASIAYARNDLMNAVRAYDKVIAKVPFHHGARVARASALIDLGRYELAVSDLKQLHESAQWDPQVGYLLAVALEKLGRTDESKQALSAAANAIGRVNKETLKEHSPSLLLSGVVTYSNRQFEESYKYLSDYLNRHPAHIGARKLLGSVLLSMNEPRKAVNALQPATISNQADARLYTLLGSAYARLKQYGRASEAFKSALKMKPGDPDLLIRLANARLATGNNRQAIADLEQAVGKTLPASRASFLLATLHLGNHNPQRAREVAQAILDKDPGNKPARNLLASIYLEQGDHAKARKLYNSLLRDDEDYRPAQLNLAKLDWLEGRRDSARRRLNEMLARNPNAIRPMIGLARIAEAEGNPRAARRWLEKAVGIDQRNIVAGTRLVDFYLRHGEKEKALDLALQLKEFHSEDHRVLMALARAYLANGQLPQATSLMKRMTTLASYNPDQLLEIARLQLKAGLTGDARWSLEKSLVTDNENFEARELLVRIALKDGNYRAADNQLVQMEALFPNSPRLHLLRGDYYMVQGQYAAAEVSFRKAFEATPSLATSTRLFRSLVAQNRLDDAIELLREWTRKHPKALPAQRMLAEALHQAGHLKEAKHYYEALSKRFPKDPGLLNNLANVYLALGDPKAMKLAHRAHELAPTDPAIADTLGWLYVLAGDYETGLKYLRDAHSRDAKSNEIRYHIAVALEGLGRTGEAKRQLQKALAQDRPFPGRSDAIRRLALLENR